jgi:hypothetical protein
MARPRSTPSGKASTGRWCFKGVGGLELPCRRDRRGTRRSPGPTAPPAGAAAADVAAAFFSAYLPNEGADEVFADGVPVVAGQSPQRHRHGRATSSCSAATTSSAAASPRRLGKACFTVGRTATYATSWGACRWTGRAQELGRARPQATASYDYTIRPATHDRTFDFFAPVVTGAPPRRASPPRPRRLGPRRHRRVDEVQPRRRTPPHGRVHLGRLGASSSVRRPGALPARAGVECVRVREAEVSRTCDNVSAVTANLVAGVSPGDQGGADITRQAYCSRAPRASGPVPSASGPARGAQHFFASPRPPSTSPARSSTWLSGPGLTPRGRGLEQGT